MRIKFGTLKKIIQEAVESNVEKNTAKVKSIMDALDLETIAAKGRENLEKLNATGWGGEDKLATARKPFIKVQKDLLRTLQKAYYDMHPYGQNERKEILKVASLDVQGLNNVNVDVWSYIAPSAEQTYAVYGGKDRYDRGYGLGS